MQRAGQAAAHKKAAYTFLQTRLISVKNMDAAVTGLNMNWFFGIIFRDRLPRCCGKVTRKPFTKVKKVSPASLIIDDIEVSVAKTGIWGKLGRCVYGGLVTGG